MSVLAALVLAACEMTFEADPIYWCVVDGDTLAVPNDTTGIRCAPVDPEDLPLP